MSIKNSRLFAKLYLDEDIQKIVADALRMRGFDVISSHELNRTGMSDVQQLDYAIMQGRSFVTFNVAHFAELDKKYTASGKRHYGIILSRQLPISEMVKRLLRLLNNFTADELENNIWWL